jgi:prophage regulatory protein
VHHVARQLIKWPGLVFGSAVHSVRWVRRIRLWGAAEIQRALGVGRTRAHEIMNRKGFPDPADDELARGAVWLQDEVEAWIAANRKPVAEPAEGDQDAG